MLLQAVPLFSSPLLTIWTPGKEYYFCPIPRQSPSEVAIPISLVVVGGGGNPEVKGPEQRGWEAEFLTYSRRSVSGEQRE